MTKRTLDNQIHDEGDLKKFRTETPNLLCDLHLTPFELALYVHLKKTAGAGKDGQCFKSTETLAAESGMSMGMVSKAKQGLLRTDRTGLSGKPLIRVEKVTGQAGKPRDIITIVDIWRENFRHALAEPEPVDSGKLPPAAPAQTSPGENQTSPGENQTSPGECNKEVLNKESFEEERGENAPAPKSHFAFSAGSAAASMPPSLEDVRRHLREIGQSESHAEKFHAYYDERGWTKGRDNRPVEDWRKTLTTWLLREPDFQGRAPGAPPRSGTPTRASAPPGQSALGTRAQEKIERLAAIKAAASPGNRLEASPGHDVQLPRNLCPGKDL